VGDPKGIVSGKCSAVARASCPPTSDCVNNYGIGQWLVSLFLGSGKYAALGNLIKRQMAILK
jgi:hypothetical protein